MEAAATGWITLADMSGFEPSHLLIPAGITLICVWLMMRYRRHQQRLVQSRRLTSGQLAQKARETRGVHGDLERLMVEVEQLAKRFAAQLDAKSIQIEDLIRAADLRIAALQQLTDQPPVTDKTAPPLSAATAPSPDPDQPATPGGPGGDELSRRVCTMADAGMAPVDIARELAEHVGKVELILSLREAG